ncbi:hypothetical protein BH18VER1_BH18VER1_11330 [soil metagenome]
MDQVIDVMLIIVTIGLLTDKIFSHQSSGSCTGGGEPV